MKILKKRSEIVSWLENYGINDYELIADEKYGFVVDVAGDAIIREKMPSSWVKFNVVSGFFDCSGNKLTSLLFCPEVVGSSFLCYDNNLKSLEGGPKEVGEDFICNYNQLKSLRYSPVKVGGDFLCLKNKLESLLGCPREVSLNFDCSNNEIKTLEYCPERVGGLFFCNGNEGLGNMQEIRGFKEIFAEHSAQCLLKEAKKTKVGLDNELKAGSAREIIVLRSRGVKI